MTQPWWPRTSRPVVALVVLALVAALLVGPAQQAFQPDLVVAAKGLVLPDPEIRFGTWNAQPPRAGYSLTLWLEPASARTVEQSVRVGGTVFEFTAEVARIEWNPGDGGGRAACDVRPNPDPSVLPEQHQYECEWIYLTPGSYRLEATAVWEVRSSHSGDAQRIKRTSAMDVAVAPGF